MMLQVNVAKNKTIIKFESFQAALCSLHKSKKWLIFKNVNILRE